MIDLTEEQMLLKSTVQDFMQAKVAPRIAQIDRTDEYAEDIIAACLEQGMFSLMVPADFGGPGGNSLVNLCLMNEEISKVAPALAIVANTENVVAMLLSREGSNEQKERYLRGLAEGKKIAAFALTEPEAGSDAAGIKMTAALKGDSYILEGTKCFCTMGRVADFIVAAARTDPKVKRGKISLFIVEKGTPGLVYDRDEEKMGMRGFPTTQLFFNEVRVPVSNRIGGEGEGFKSLMRWFDGTHCTVGAIGTGIAQGAFSYALEYAKRRVQFDQPIANFQAVQFMLADMATGIEAARCLTLKAATLYDRNDSQAAIISAMSKYYGTDVAMKVTTDALQIMGGYGYTKDHPVERLMRDAKATQIFDGTNQIQRMVVARRLLKG